MPLRLLFAPTWVKSVAIGGSYAVLMALALASLRNSAGEVAWGAVFQGVLFGAFVGPVTADRQRDLLTCLDPLPVDRRIDAVRVAKSGPVPDDRELRAAAARYVRELLNRRERSRRKDVVVGCLIIVMSIGLAVLDRWLLLGIVLGLVTIAEARVDLVRLPRRLFELEAGAADDAQD